MAGEMYIAVTCALLLLVSAQNERPFVEETMGISIPGGQYQFRGSINACKAACLGTCKGIDYDTYGRTCWFHFDDTVCDKTKRSPSIVHVTYTTCPVPPAEAVVSTFSQFSNRHIRGGTLQRFTDEDSCLRGCTGDCGAVDFSAVPYGEPTCWYHMNDTQCGMLMNKYHCTHYKRVDCPDTTPPPTQVIVPAVEVNGPDTTEFPKYHVRGGYFFPGVRSKRMCQEKCVYLGSNACVAYDYNYASRACWFHNSTTACSDLVSKRGCIHTRIFPCPPSAPLPATPAPAPATPAPAPATPAPAPATPAPAPAPATPATPALAPATPATPAPTPATPAPAPATPATSAPAPAPATPAPAPATPAPAPATPAPAPATPAPAPATPAPAPATPAPAPTSAPAPATTASTIPTPATTASTIPTTASTISTPATTASTTPAPATSSRACGQPAVSPNVQRIIGGEEAVKNSWPWQAGLVLVQNGSPSLMCGATLISSTEIATAAHCVSGNENNPQNFRIVLGDHDLTLNSISEPEQQVHTPTGIDVHPQYNPSSSDYDVAIIHLGQPASLTNAVMPVCLPAAGAEPASGTECVATGWGRTSTNSNSGATVLQQVTLPIITGSDCNAANVYNGIITDRMICAGIAQGGIDTCNGDSGGPLSCQENGVWVLHGLTSFGAGCALPNRPGVYAKVSNADMIAFIRENSSNLP